MDSSPAQSIILGTMAVTVIDAIVSNLQTTQSRVPASRILIGGYLATMILLIGSDVAPELAEATSILVMIGSLLGPDGGAFIKLISKASSKNILTNSNAGLTPVKGVS